MTIAPILVEMTRDGLVESIHRGHAVLLNQKGEVEKVFGNENEIIYPRSAIKLAQATAMLKVGAKLENETLAISCASHSGEDLHTKLVKKMLENIGLSETDLQCPPDLPLDPKIQIEYLAKGFKPESVTMNCSGKHAGMLSACVANNWSTKDYLKIDHPLQQKVIETIEELCQEEITKSSVDGCGAPLHAISLIGLARMARNAVLAEGNKAERKVADAARKYPIYNSGSNKIGRAHV